MSEVIETQRRVQWAGELAHAAFMASGFGRQDLHHELNQLARLVLSGEVDFNVMNLDLDREKL
jgi:hypothetical protein